MLLNYVRNIFYLVIYYEQFLKSLGTTGLFYKVFLLSVKFTINKIKILSYSEFCKKKSGIKLWKEFLNA